jgi:hypothetical protein
VHLSLGQVSIRSEAFHHRFGLRKERSRAERRDLTNNNFIIAQWHTWKSDTIGENKNETTRRSPDN